MQKVHVTGYYLLVERVMPLKVTNRKLSKAKKSTLIYDVTNSQLCALPSQLKPTFSPSDSSFLSRNVLRASFLLTWMNLSVTSSNESWLWENVRAASWYLIIREKITLT